MMIIREFRVKLKPTSRNRDKVVYFTAHDSDKLPDIYDQLIDLNTAEELLTINGDHFLDGNEVELIEYVTDRKVKN